MARDIWGAGIILKRTENPSFNFEANNGDFTIYSAIANDYFWKKGI